MNWMPHFIADKMVYQWNLRFRHHIKFEALSHSNPRKNSPQNLKNWNAHLKELIIAVGWIYSSLSFTPLTILCTRIDYFVSLSSFTELCLRTLFALLILFVQLSFRIKRHTHTHIHSIERFKLNRQQFYHIQNFCI